MLQHSCFFPFRYKFKQYRNSLKTSLPCWFLGGSHRPAWLSTLFWAVSHLPGLNRGHLSHCGPWTNGAPEQGVGAGLPPYSPPSTGHTPCPIPQLAAHRLRGRQEPQGHKGWGI